MRIGGSGHRSRRLGRIRRVLLPFALAIIGLSLVALAFLAVLQLQSIADVYAARELRALGQYARLAAREVSYQVSQAEGRVLEQLAVENEDALVASLAAIESRETNTACCAILRDGRVLYPATEEADWGGGVDTLIARRDVLIDTLREAGVQRVHVDGGGYPQAVSCYYLVSGSDEGIVAFLWHPDTVARWCRRAALEAVPAGYVTDLRDADCSSVSRYPILGGVPDDRGGLSASEPLGLDGVAWTVTVRPEDAKAVAELVRHQVLYYSAGIGIIFLALAVGTGILAVATWRAAELARLKADFAANVSHELRTPLALIRAAGESLATRQNLSPERAARYFSMIDRETRRLTDLVNNVLRFSRKERKEAYRLESVDLAALVREFAEDYADHLARLGGRLHTHIAEGPITCRVDADAFLVVLVNLLDNAVKFSPDGTPVDLELALEGVTACLRVRDKGIGVAPEHQPRIFDAFYRVETDLVKKTRGTGIGLALVREIVRAHDGEIRVDSRPGEGAVFTVWLPVRTGQDDERG